MKNKKQKTLKDLYKEAFSFIKESRRFIYFACGVFLAFAIIGYFVQPPKALEAVILNALEGIVSRFDGLNQWETIWGIFSNNLSASFFSMILGLTIIFPFIMIMVNGYLIGYVANKAVLTYGILILWKLVPHGIFELPAILISVGFGMRITYSMFNSREKFGRVLKDSLRAFILVILPLLLVAAIIEGLLVFYMG